jgi:hypothetical protein
VTLRTHTYRNLQDATKKKREQTQAVFFPMGVREKLSSARARMHSHLYPTQGFCPFPPEKGSSPAPSSWKPLWDIKWFLNCLEWRRRFQNWDGLGWG